MPYIDAGAQRLLDELDPSLRDFERLSPAELRANAELMVLEMREPIELAAVTDVRIPTRAGQVGGRLYQSTLDVSSPLFVYFHGGGWALGSLELSDRPLRRLARDSGFTILSIDYRLAPEHPFPAGLEDCYDATVWAVENSDALRVDPSWLVVGGDSAGGNLAAAVAQLARDTGRPRIDHQLLVYPVVTPDFESQSYLSFGENYFLTRAMMQYYWRIYAGASPPKYADLLKVDNLAGLAPATVITCALDPLASEGQLYAEMLDRDGVETTFIKVGGLLHGFWYRDVVSPAARRFGLTFAEALRHSRPSEA